jgi:metal-responsive CopG/Arc/MetJ family transcriptional regulator
MKLIKPEIKHIDYDTISLRLDHLLLKEFDAELDRLGLTRSEAIRQLIIEYMKTAISHD